MLARSLFEDDNYTVQGPWKINDRSCRFKNIDCMRTCFQLSRDPQTVTTLIGCNPRLVNCARRSDGLTPLHLVASRSDLSDAVAKIEALDESSQISMVRILLDAGAGRSAAVDLEGKALLPMDLCDGRPAVKRLLEVAINAAANGLSIPSPPESSTSRSHSPGSGTLGLSPSPPSVENPNNLASMGAASMFEVMMPTPSSVGSSCSRGLCDSSSSSDLSDDCNVEDPDVIAQVLGQHPAITAALDDALGGFEVNKF